jgi:hypothetical protein
MNWQHGLSMCQHVSMAGKSGSAHQLADLPEDLAPELRRLAECLRSHFEELDVSIRTYAQHAPWDAGTVSRFLSGERVASHEFIDRLVADAGAQHTAEEIAQDTAQAQDLRTNALRIRNARAAESERLTQELREAEEEIKLFQTRERLLTKELASADNQYQLLLERFKELQKTQDLTGDISRQIEGRQEVRDVAENKDTAEKEVHRLQRELEIERSARIEAEERRDSLQAELDRNRTDLLRSGGSSAPAALYGSQSTLMAAIRDRRNHWGNWIAVIAIPVVVLSTPVYLGLIYHTLSGSAVLLKVITICGITVPIWLAREARKTSRRTPSKIRPFLLRLIVLMIILFLIAAFI